MDIVPLPSWPSNRAGAVCKWLRWISTRIRSWQWLSPASSSLDSRRLAWSTNTCPAQSDIGSWWMLCRGAHRVPRGCRTTNRRISNNPSARWPTRTAWRLCPGRNRQRPGSQWTSSERSSAPFPSRWQWWLTCCPRPRQSSAWWPQRRRQLFPAPNTWTGTPIRICSKSGSGPSWRCCRSGSRYRSGRPAAQTRSGRFWTPCPTY